MADTDIPEFKIYADGEPIPPVDPEDLRRRWNIKTPRTREAVEEAESHEADSSAVSRRQVMIILLTAYNSGQLLAPWHHGEELDDAVFRIAATFPLHEVRDKNYMIPGDEFFGFDFNAFVQRLIEETGISHVWKPVATKVPEGGRGFVTASARFAGQVPNPEREAKQLARQVLWGMWKRFAPSLDKVVSHSDKEQASEIVAMFFANFLLDNIDLVRQLEDSFKEPQSIPMDPILSELERRAQDWPGLPRYRT